VTCDREHGQGHTAESKDFHNTCSLAVLAAAPRPRGSLLRRIHRAAVGAAAHLTEPGSAPIRRCAHRHCGTFDRPLPERWADENGAGRLFRDAVLRNSSPAADEHEDSRTRFGVRHRIRGGHS
jgi:hypothetical protein